jgi:3-oxosteroid 1-dehydrogenase
MTPEVSEFDVIVAGSGAAGMTAALTAAHRGLSVVVIEKTGHVGGSTARSGGGVWVPGNEVLDRAGVPDTPEQERATPAPPSWAAATREPARRSAQR